MSRDPVASQESLYRLPYHWFPQKRLGRFAREQKQRLLFALLDAHRPPSIERYLDVGCGDGRWTFDVAGRLGDRVEAVGIDFSERAIGFARLISPHLDFRVQRAEALPFADASCDLITSIEVLEHVEDDSERAFLGELRRVCRPGGLLLLTTPSVHLPLTPHHFRHYTPERLRRLLEEAGFEVLALRGLGRRFPVRWWGLRKEMASWPLLWKVWRFTHRRTSAERCTNLIVAARPGER